MQRAAAICATDSDCARRYWNGRGLMEVPRQLLAIAGRFPGKGYVDKRIIDDEKGGRHPSTGNKDRECFMVRACTRPESLSSSSLLLSQSPE